MRKFSLTIAICALLFSLGCTKKTVTAPVPGSINALDAWAFRIVSDSTASIHSVKIWEQCSAGNFPASVVVDGATEPCDSKAGMFPVQYKPQLNLAINSLNTAAAAGKAYHAGASNDPSGLTAAITQLTTAINQLMLSIGGH